MSDYAWIITKDYLFLDDPETFTSAQGVMGPHNITQEQEQALNSGKGRVFYMYDDDKELYYKGRIVGTDGDDHNAFRPLDDFGLPNAGCTLIKYHGQKDFL